jgi:hypothetical protein
MTEPRTDSTAQPLRLAAHAYLRYAAPLTLLSVVVLAPWLVFALAMPAPRDQISARAVLGASWVIGATAWIGQLLLVGAAAPLARALDAGAPLSQLRALGRGALHLTRAAVPWLAAVATIALGGLALALPGLALLVLLSTTAASTRPGLPEPLAESVAIVRRRLPLATIAVVMLLAVDLGAVVIAQAMLRPPSTGKLGPDQLAALRRILEVEAIAIVAIAPPIAALLAAVHTRAPRA